MWLRCFLGFFPVWFHRAEIIFLLLRGGTLRRFADIKQHSQWRPIGDRLLGNFRNSYSKFTRWSAATVRQFRESRGASGVLVRLLLWCNLSRASVKSPSLLEDKKTQPSAKSVNSVNIMEDSPTCVYAAHRAAARLLPQSRSAAAGQHVENTYRSLMPLFHHLIPLYVHFD